MKVVFEDNKIKIRKDEGIMLVVDSGVPDDLQDIVKQLATEMDIPFPNINNIPKLDQPGKNMGDLIFPFVENLSLQDKCSLIILYSKRIYDIDDFKSEIQSRFSKVGIYDINEEHTEAEWRDRFKPIICDFSINNIEVIFNSAVPYEWDNELYDAIADTAKKLFLLTRNIKVTKKLDIPLAIRGTSEKTNIQIKVNDSIFYGCIKNDTTPPILQWKMLSEEDAKQFKNHIKEYKNSNFHIDCNLCGIKHDFEQPFLCEKNKKKSLSFQLKGGTLILEGIRNYKEGIIFFRVNGNKIKYLVAEKGIIELEDYRFIFRKDKEVFNITCEDNVLDIRKCISIQNKAKENTKLYEFDEDSIVYLLK